MWNNADSFITKDQLQKDSLKYPLGYGEVSDAASLVCFLVSDESRWITGSSILADGGFTAN
jgi:NAD(P)-dependent dehydrogenase (short-subunit alcohol dehydrogenase family)